MERCDLCGLRNHLAAARCTYILYASCVCCGNVNERPPMLPTGVVGGLEGGIQSINSPACMGHRVWLGIFDRGIVRCVCTDTAWDHSGIAGFAVGDLPFALVRNQLLAS